MIGQAKIKIFRSSDWGGVSNKATFTVSEGRHEQCN